MQVNVCAAGHTFERGNSHTSQTLSAGWYHKNRERYYDGVREIAATLGRPKTDEAI
jgi:hypothetical protein